MLKTMLLALLFAISVPVLLATGDVRVAVAQGAGQDHDHAQDHDHDYDHEDEDYDHEEHGASGHVSEMNGIRSIHAWMRASHKGDDGLVFVSLENASDRQVIFEGGAFDHARSVELVGFTMQDGKDVYVPLAHMPIAAGQQILLAPKSLALRLNRLDQDFHKGDVMHMHLLFDGSQLDVSVNVEAENAMHHSHAGHIHK
ncbi:copper chaperone PCu(A)C [uncultured Cohaesibacter sp.]|uniref:copper chaperone PCu(A)C n=1 Tax=uncultured Cohaesibacter sp. TaxID=1002546 RepID=UPI0029C67E1D|nr:copper chaperone PCu(A)C [uncultured Cohaesibacter sp.]